jgi:hypothetical protein
MQTGRAEDPMVALVALISVCALASCAAAKPIDHPLLSFDVANGEDDVELDLAVLRTGLRGRDGKPVMASPRDSGYVPLVVQTTPSALAW